MMSAKTARREYEKALADRRRFCDPRAFVRHEIAKDGEAMEMWTRSAARLSDLCLRRAEKMLTAEAREALAARRAA